MSLVSQRKMPLSLGNTSEMKTNNTSFWFYYYYFMTQAGLKRVVCYC